MEVSGAEFNLLSGYFGSNSGLSKQEGGLDCRVGLTHWGAQGAGKEDGPLSCVPAPGRRGGRPPAICGLSQEFLPVVRFHSGANPFGPSALVFPKVELLSNLCPIAVVISLVIVYVFQYERKFYVTCT